MMLPKSIEWSAGSLEVSITLDAERHVYLQSIRNTGAAAPIFDEAHNHALPLTEIRVAGEGNDIRPGTSKRAMGSYPGRRMCYVRHRTDETATSRTLVVESHDDQTGITVFNHLTVHGDVPVIRCFAEVRNDNATQTQVLQLVSSLAIGGLSADADQWSEDYHVQYANSSWFREAQWVDFSLPDVGLDDMAVADIGHNTTRALFEISNVGSFSSNGHLPMGALEKTDGTKTWLWSVEHNGGWRWEIGDYEERLYLVASGPDDSHHRWQKPLAPSESFKSATCALAVVHGSVDLAFQAMTKYRRLVRRQHEDNEKLPVIFNDFMNCLMGDPTTEKVLALVGPAARAGAEYFVIDCGWYADDAGWWITVGEWRESKKRFPEGLRYLTDKIREAGMKPGLWIEPEVMGVNCPALKSFPPEAFFTRNGQKIVEQGRHQLDFRCEFVHKSLTATIARLVDDYGAEYFKFDYNIDVTAHTDLSCSSPGEAALDHNRAYLGWVSSLMDKYPNLAIETCSSGGQRLDGALLALHPIQSTSDQQDPLLYAGVSVSIPTAVTPEQSASWAYPQLEWSDETTALTVVNSLLGRVHLSGRLDLLGEKQFQLVKDGMDVYKRLRLDLKHAVPFWPLGLHRVWSNEWVALGMACADGNTKYVSIWRRPKIGNRVAHVGKDRNTSAVGNAKCDIPMRELKGTHYNVHCLYPEPTEYFCATTWNVQTGVLSVEVPSGQACARLLRIDRAGA